MTFDEIRTNVGVWLGNRSDIDTSVRDVIINRAYQRYMIPFRFHELEQTNTLNTVADTATVSLSSLSNFYEALTCKNTTTGRLLDQKDIEWYEQQDDTAESGEPKVFVIYGSNMILWPVPEQIYALRVRWRGLLAALSAGADVPAMPLDWHSVIEYEAASELAFMYDMDERGQMLKNMAMSEISTRQEPGTLDRKNIKGRVSMRRTRNG